MEGAEMSHTHKRMIATLAALLAAAALGPGAGVASAGAGPEERTPTELGQAVGEPGEQESAATRLFSRTPTELGQRVTPSAIPAVESSGFDWDDAAIGAGAALALVGLGGCVGILLVRRRRAIPSPRVPAVSG
jgi:hypothetical protein